MRKLPLFFMKMTITQPRKVQIPKFWCLKSSTNIWQSCGNIYSIPKTQKIDWEGKQISKLAKIGQFFALKKLKMNFLKNFPGFYFKSFLCVFLYVSMNFSHWQNLCDTPDLVCSLHRHRVLYRTFIVDFLTKKPLQFSPQCQKKTNFTFLFTFNLSTQMMQKQMHF